MKRIITRFFVAALLLALLSCGDSSDGDEQTFIRVVNLAPDVPSVNLVVNSDVYYSNIPYLTATEYGEIDTQSQEIQVFASGSFVSLFDQNVSLSDTREQTVTVYGPAIETNGRLVQDENDKPGGGLVKLRVFNGSKAAASADVYILRRGVSVGDSTPSVDNLGYGSMSEYLVSDSGTYTVTVTNGNSKEPLSATTNQVFGEDSVFSIYIGDADGGSRPVDLFTVQDSN